MEPRRSSGGGTNRLPLVHATTRATFGGRLRTSICASGGFVRSARPLNGGIRVVRVNAFFVNDADTARADPVVASERCRNCANDVFYERWVFVCLHGHVALVCPLEE